MEALKQNARKFFYPLTVKFTFAECELYGEISVLEDDNPLTLVLCYFGLRDGGFGKPFHPHVTLCWFAFEVSCRKTMFPVA